MAENNPNIPSVPPGAVPPKPAEAAKVQPKKETVRISLPPKPTSSPTIKLPTLPAGAPPPPSAVGAPPPPPPAAGAPSAPRTLAPPAAAAAPAVARPPTSGGAPAQRPPSAAVPAARPAAAGAHAAARKVSGLDVGLSIAAAVMALGAVASVSLLLNIK